MNAADVMSRNVLTVAPTDSIQAAARLMLENRISGLPVVDVLGRVTGMLTEGDLLKRSETGTEPSVSAWRALWLGPQRLAERYVHAHGRTVDEVMTRHVISVTGETPLTEVVALMESRRVKRLPVLRDGRPIGIISRADLLRALQRLLPQAGGPAASDAAIRSAIVQQMRAQSWAPRELVDVRVENGAVWLRGIVTQPAEREALRVLAENTAGVRRVIDELVWVEPYTGISVVVPPA
jgi:CBS domain-containing protein